MDTALSTNKLSKRYPGSRVYALKDLSIKVNKGEVYGFLGPNGAGKSTTIRLLMNFIQPTEGSANILGKDSVKDRLAIKRSVGYLSGDFVAYPKMTARQFIDYMSDLQPPKHSTYAKDLASLFKVNLNQRLGSMSKGNRQKIGVIQAFMHEPELLILDEPTAGLDPLMQETFYSLARDFKKRGATLFVSSHNLAEVQKMCDRIGFIREGKLISEQSISELAIEASQTFDIVFAGKVPLQDLKRIPGVKRVKVIGNSVTVHLHGDLSKLFTVLAKNKVKSLTTRELNLEQEFLQFYEGKDNVANN